MTVHLSAQSVSGGDRERLRRAAWAVVDAFDVGEGLSVAVNRLAETLDATPGWSPGGGGRRD